MKKKFLIIIAISVMISCTNKDSDKKNLTTKGDSKSSVVKGELKSLKYKYSKGMTFKYKLNSITSNHQSIFSDSSISTSMKQNAQYVFSFKVLDVTDNKITTISVTPVSIYVKSIIGDKSIVYDSKVIYSTREQAMFADYEAMKNRTFKVKVSEIGEVIDLYDIDKIVNRIFVLQGIKDSFTSEQREQYKKNFIVSGLAPIVEQFFRKTTLEKVGVESVWKQEYPSSLANLKIINTASYKVLGFNKVNEDSIAKISANLSVSWTGNNTATQEGITYHFSNPDISGSGEIYFNLSKTLVSKSKTKIRSLTEVKMTSANPKNNSKSMIQKESLEVINNLELL